MTNNITTTDRGERLSFHQLFVDRNFRLVIPIIQREYAQGRSTDSARDVRTNFLEALFGYLSDNIPGRDLDFVYGNIEDHRFIPLDGQQRLTTLFLLHWYLAQANADSPEAEEYLKQMVDDNGHSRFTYETRISASDFCDALIQNRLDLNNLPIPEQDSTDGPIATALKKRNWYYRSWAFDPTIQSMLRMLDAIHNQFKGHPEFFGRLIDLKEPIITFLFMDLKKYKLTDDIYIKMNSRGKPLTDFENFKAKYEQWIGTIPQKEFGDKKFNIKFSTGSQSLTPQRYFAHKIDTSWTNLVWAYRSDGNRQGEECDRKMTNFIRAIFAADYAGGTTVKKDADADETLKQLNASTTTLSFNGYSEGGVLTATGALYLMEAFNVLTNGNDKINCVLADEYRKYYDENQVFENALNSKFANRGERVRMHAYLRFRIMYGDDAGINEWMRFISILTEPDTQPIDSYLDFVNAIRSVNDLLPQAPHILEYLAKKGHVAFFPSWQVEEEYIKASLVLRQNGEEWKKRLRHAEDHGYFKGQIGFLLHFAGIRDYFTNHSDTAWDDEADKQYAIRFDFYEERARATFANSYEDRINDTEKCFERAVLSKGDYLTEANHSRWNMLSTTMVKNNIKRDHSWKRLLRLSDDQWFLSRQECVKKLFDDKTFNPEKPVESMCKICSDAAPTGDTWRNLLVKYPHIIGYSQQGFIGFYDNDSVAWGDVQRESIGIIPFYQSQTNHLHLELYTFALGIELRIAHDFKNYGFSPFEFAKLTEQKVNNEIPYLLFYGYKFSRISYDLEIRARINGFVDPTITDKWELHHFEFRFTKEASTTNTPELYNRDVVDILTSRGYKWHEGEYPGYYLEVTPTLEAAKAEISELSEALGALKEKAN